MSIYSARVNRPTLCIAGSRAHGKTRVHCFAALLVMLASLIALGATAEPEGEGVEDVKRVLLKNASGFERGDFALLDSIWAHDEGVTVFENGYANYGWEDYRNHHLKPEVEEMKHVKYELSDIRPAVEGRTAWATFKYMISAEHEGKQIEANGLGTAILQRRSDGWKIVHWHTSAPRKKPAEPAGAGTPSGMLGDYASLVALLQSSGLRVEALGDVEQPFFTPNARAIRIAGSGEAQVYAYQTVKQALEETAHVSADGSIGTSMPMWTAPPHFFRKSSLVVLYLGSDDATLRTLRAAFGEQFAGKGSR